MGEASARQTQRSDPPAAPRAMAAERAPAVAGISNQLLQLALRGPGAAGASAGSDGKPAPGLNGAMAQARQPSQSRRESRVLQQLAQHGGGGEPLPASLRVPAERSLEVDLGNVLLHRGEGARAVTAAAGARAAQWRDHIFVRPDLYAPHSTEGRKLLGHELVHAGQRQSGACAGSGLSSPRDPAEAEATRLRSAALSGVPGAARTQRSPSSAVSLDEPIADPTDVSSLPQQVCDPDLEPGSSSEDPALDGDAPADDGMGYCIDPTLVDVSILTNEDLILQGIEARMMIDSFESSDQQTEDWRRLNLDIETERSIRVGQGFVFMATAKDAVPTELFQLRPGPISGTTGIYVAYPEHALGAESFSPTEGVFLSKEQLGAYLAASGMAEVGGEEAAKVVGLLEAGDGAGLLAHFAAAREPAYDKDIPLGPIGPPLPADYQDSGLDYNTTGPLPPAALSYSGMLRSTLANDLVSYGADHWRLPIDRKGINAMGRMGEATALTTGKAAWSPYTFNLNHPDHKWTDVLGVERSLNSPIADYLIGGDQLFDGGLFGIPHSNVTTLQTNQALATRAMMNKFAALIDIAGRRGVKGEGAKTPDMAAAHVQQMAKNSGLTIGTPEFDAARSQFLSDTMFAVPRKRLAEIRDAVSKPFEGRANKAGGRPDASPAALDGFRALYDEVLRATPIQVKVGKVGSTRAETIDSYSKLISHLPNTVLTPDEAAKVPGGAGWDNIMKPGEQTRVFELLGRMAASRIIASEDATRMVASSDTLRQVGVLGIDEAPTRVLAMDIAGFADSGLRMRAGLNDARTPESAGELPWITGESARQADNYLSFARMMSGNPALTRDTPEFDEVRAKLTRNAILSLPVDQQQPLIDALVKSNSPLATDIRAAVAADTPDFDMNTFADQFERQTRTFNLSPSEQKGTRDYAVQLFKDHGNNAGNYISSDMLALKQNPGLRGVGLRGYRGAGQNFMANLFGYGINYGLDSATNRDAQMPSWQRMGVDLGISLTTEEVERQIAGRALSKVPIANALARGVFQKATPGFVFQPAISVGMEEYSIRSDEELYAQLELEMTAEERSGRRWHAAGVGLVGAGAGVATTAGALYVIGQFTGGGAAVGGVGGAGVGAAPGALVGFLVGVGAVAVGAGAAWLADKKLPNSREDYMKEHQKVLDERFRKEKERLDAIRSGQLPIKTLEGPNIPLPYRLSKDISLQEQAIIASYLMANAQR